MRHSTALAILLGFMTACATAYQPSGVTGGFTETRLSERVLQVRVSGNAYTSQDKASIYILRRCAEVTLEHGYRYLTLGAHGTGSVTSGSSGFIFSFPHGSATVKFLADRTEDPTPLDAILIIRDTARAAQGRLSEFAREAIAQLESGVIVEGAPPRGTEVRSRDGQLTGYVAFTVPSRVFSATRKEPAVALVHSSGGRLWLPLSDVLSALAK